MTKKTLKAVSGEAWPGLKIIAAARVTPPDPTDPDGITDEQLIDYAKWQICKARNILFLDPIWGEYTEEEILIEFFSISYDENPDSLNEFLSKTKEVDHSTLEWFEKMEKQHTGKREDEFEDSY